MMRKMEDRRNRASSENVAGCRRALGRAIVCLVLLGLAGLAFATAQDRKGKIISVADGSLEIDLGYLDGVEVGNAGTVFFEVVVGGEKRKVLMAKFEIVEVYGAKSKAKILDKKGEIRANYSIDLNVPESHKTPDYFLQQANARFECGDYNGALEFYTRITELLPGDLYATERIKECNARIAEQKEKEKELQNIPYYRSAIEALLKQKNYSQVNMYARKILSLHPDDQVAQEALSKIREEAQPDKLESAPTEPAARAGAAKPERVENPLDGMVYISGGEIMLGEDDKGAEYYNEQPAHMAKLAPFYIDKYEVTNAQYKKFIDATGSAPPPHWQHGHYPPEQGNFPVTNITWDEANAYAKWAGKRLPSEAEWELAARGTDHRKWPWGNKSSKSSANILEAKLREPAAIGSFAADVSPFGVYDMGGNVSEWTADWYRAYSGNDFVEEDYGKKHKVLRGGSFNTKSSFARCAFRAHLRRDFRALDLGFRCARDATDQARVSR